MHAKQKVWSYPIYATDFFKHWGIKCMSNVLNDVLVTDTNEINNGNDQLYFPYNPYTLMNKSDLLWFEWSGNLIQLEYKNKEHQFWCIIRYKHKT